MVLNRMAEHPSPMVCLSSQTNVSLTWSMKALARAAALLSADVPAMPALKRHCFAGPV